MLKTSFLCNKKQKTALNLILALNYSRKCITSIIIKAIMIIISICARRSSSCGWFVRNKSVERRRESLPSLASS